MSMSNKHLAFDVPLGKAITINLYNLLKLVKLFSKMNGTTVLVLLLILEIRKLGLSHLSKVTQRVIGWYRIKSLTGVLSPMLNSFSKLV